ncbi:MAG: GNAT family N-acetyltransferase [Clostridium sp.]|nr:GNAT family N-acetyltransferase [Clostridium sp.]
MDNYQITNYVTVEEYQTFRKSTNWKIFKDKQAKAGLEHSTYIVCIRLEGKAIAMARFLWDCGYIAYIADVIVLPEFQGKGLGRMLMENILAYIDQTIPKDYDLMISLVAAKGKNTFYEKFGFISRPNSEYGPGMHLFIDAIQ